MDRFSNLLTRCIDWFYIKPVARIVPRQTFRYGAVGALNLVLTWVLYYLANHFVICDRFVDMGVISVSPHIATLCVIVPFTFLAGFYLNRNVAFTRSPLRDRTQFVRYLLSWSGSLVINYALLKVFVEVLGFWDTPSQMLASVIIVGYSYLMQKYFAFRGCEE